MYIQLYNIYIYHISIIQYGSMGHPFNQPASRDHVSGFENCSFGPFGSDKIRSYRRTWTHDSSQRRARQWPCVPAKQPSRDNSADHQSLQTFLFGSWLPCPERSPETAILPKRSWLDEVANAAKGFRWWLMRGWEVLPICRCTSRGWEDCREVRGYQSLSHTLTSRLWSILVLSYVQRYVVFACDAKWLQLKWLTYCNVNLGLIHL